ncbi:hypothetical protein FVR03_01385 [Pontibacter qinzhouensis]|uniref:Uncharacterized protein n=1 Tax=Pontibacter qinzhouensis TaxID=2603253 RepID=A0A5C8KCQ9_9BACT|nr:hypothetical protein [Pontibacter qinzhouensis]TXK52397.1 hypothetical protein FVR03_01385 [Pontibacter qinzhouensis]
MTYNAQRYIVHNKSLGIVGKPLDGRAYWSDGVNERPFNSLAEVRTYFDTTEKRAGHFLILVGNVPYWFLPPYGDANLVPFLTGTVDSTPVQNGTRPISSGWAYNLQQSISNLTNGGISYSAGSLFQLSEEVKLDLNYYMGVWQAQRYQKGWITLSTDRKALWKARQTHNSSTAPQAGANWELLFQIPTIDQTPQQGSVNGISSGYIHEQQQTYAYWRNNRLERFNGTEIPVTGGDYRFPTGTPAIPVTAPNGLGRYTPGQSIPVVGKTMYEVLLDIAGGFAYGDITMVVSPSTLNYNIGDTPTINISGEITPNGETSITNRRFLYRPGTSGTFLPYGTFNNLAYTYNVSPRETTTYRVEFTNTAGLVISRQVVISFAQAPTTTPAAPTINADDSANTLQATHSLGATEILVSVNNGAYAQYNGAVINVGDVDRPFGYWKFKTKAATGRNESPVANSPEFTAMPSYNTTLSNGQNVQAVTLTSLPGLLFHYNEPMPGGDPFPARMEIFAGATQIGAVDHAVPYIGQPCAITYNGTMYHKSFIDGDLNILA